MDELKFSIKLKTIDMYRFFMFLSYSGKSLVINMGISIGALLLLLAGAAETTISKVALIIVAALFPVIQPIRLYFSANRQLKRNPMYEKPMEYTVNAEGILVSQGEETMPVAWNTVTKIIEKKHSIYIFATVSAAIFILLPKEALGDKAPVLLEMAKKNVNAACKCKF